MGIGRGKISIALLLLVSSLCVEIISAIDTITSTQILKDPEAIVSYGSIYKLGFFSLVNSTNRYVGIWFNEIPEVTALWVASKRFSGQVTFQTLFQIQVHSSPTLETLFCEITTTEKSSGRASNILPIHSFPI